MYILAPDQQQEIPLKLTMNNKKYRLYRVGALGDGKCLLHALLFLNSSDYRNADHQMRQQFVLDLIEKLIKELTIDKWASTIMKSQTFELMDELRRFLTRQGMTEQEIDKAMDGVPIECETLNLFCENTSRYIRERTTVSTNPLDDLEKFIATLCQIFWKRYISQMKLMNDMGHFEIEFIAKETQSNIILIDNRMELFYENRINPDYEKCYLLLNSGQHWEPIIVRMDDGDDAERVENKETAQYATWFSTKDLMMR